MADDASMRLFSSPIGKGSSGLGILTHCSLKRLLLITDLLMICKSVYSLTLLRPHKKGKGEQMATAKGVNGKILTG